MGCILELNTQNLDVTLSVSRVPMLVDFWGDDCAKCEAMKPIVHELADEIPRLAVGLFKVEQTDVVVGRFDLRGIPTLILFKYGKPVWRLTGFRAKSDLVTDLADYLL